jgi:NADPH:quinone reductase-like Zn-dependent oxidoreductase
VQAIIVADRDAGLAGLSLSDLPYPHMAENDVVVRVHAAGFTPGELAWPTTWTDRAGRDRRPSVPGHEVSGVVAELGYGTTGLSVGQRVFGLTDWARDGSLAEYVAVEARNLAPLPADVDHAAAAATAISGLTAWQALFVHARIQAGQTVLIHGAAGGVGTIAVQLARGAGAAVIGTGRTADKDIAKRIGVDKFIDLSRQDVADAGQVDVVLDVIGGEVRDRSTALLRPGGTLVTIAGPPQIQPADGRAIFFVVEPDRAQLTELASRLRDGRIAPTVAAEHSLPEANAALGPDAPRLRGKTIIRVAQDLFAREHGLGLALKVDVRVAADVDGDPPDGAAGEVVRRAIRVVLSHRLATVAPDAQAFARDREQAGLGLDPTFADLLVPVIEGQDPGSNPGRLLPVFVERGRQDEVLAYGDLFSPVDLLLHDADEVVDVVQPVVLDIEGVAAEP